MEEIKSLKPDIRLPVVYLPHLRGYKYTVKKEKKIFLIFRKIRKRAVAMSYIRKGFLMYEEMRKYLTIYEETVGHMGFCNCFILKFLIYEETFIFFFISASTSTICTLYSTCVLAD